MSKDYSAEILSEPIKGKGKLALEIDGLVVSTLLDSYYIPYSVIKSFSWQNHSVRIFTADKSFTISRLGNLGESFFHELFKSYNSKVRQALFVKGSPSFQTKANYRYVESGVMVQGTAVIEVYENCILVLPPNERARRIPLCFANSLGKADFGLSLKLNTGERYCFGRLGLETEVFVHHIERSLHSLREKNLRAIRDIDTRLNIQQIADIARIMPEGAAVPLIRLHQIAPSFVQSLETKIANSSVAAIYQFFKQSFDIGQLCVGAKRGLHGEKSENIIWLIAPGKNADTAAVEFAVSEETAAATFLCGSFTDWEVFRRKLNQSMEAIEFRREVIHLSDKELLKPECALYAMAVERNPALQYIRRHFSGRLIHSSPERWKQGLISFMS